MKNHNIRRFPVTRGVIELQFANRLDKWLTQEGTYGVTSPTFINGSKKFTLEVIPIDDTPGDFIQRMTPSDTPYPKVFQRMFISGAYTEWEELPGSSAAGITSLANAAIGIKLAEILLLRSITTKVVSGTDPVSIIPETVEGSNIIPANTWVTLGSRIHVKLRGLITTGTSTTGKLDIKVAGTTLEGTALTYPNSLTDMPVEIDLEITLVTATTVRVTGLSIIQTAQGTATPYVRGIASATDITIDPEAAIEIDGLLTLGGGEGGSFTVRELTMLML